MSGSCCAVYTSELCVVVLISNVRFVCTKMSSCFLVFALMVLSAFLLFVQLSWSMFLHYSAVVLIGGWCLICMCYVLQCYACLLFYHVAYHYRFCVLASTASLFFFVCGGGVLLCWTSYYIYRRAIWRAACPRGGVVVYYIRLLLLLWAFWECCRRSVVVVCTMICFLDDCQGVSCLYVLL